jgi:MoaA/NifB/PqqE/SkfB family radical SAM enzyme
MANEYIKPTAKLWYHVDRLAAIKRGEQPAPVNVEIDLSNRCQMGCSFCHFAHTHSKGPLAHKREFDTGDLMDYQLALDILEQLNDAGVRSITWSGGGEPTLHPKIAQIVTYAHELGFDQGIYTNGLRLEYKGLKKEFRGQIPNSLAGLAKVLKRTMKWIYLSHGPHGLDELLKADGDAKIGVGMMVDSRNINAIYSNAMKASKADYFHIRPIVGGVIRETDIEIIDVLVKAIRANGINIIYDPARFEMYRNWDGHKYPTCYWTQVQSVITPDGRVWACCNRRGFEDSLLGDLSKQSWDVVWGNSKAWRVDENCRRMCRGHIPNLTLTEIMEPSNEHKNFI